MNEQYICEECGANIEAYFVEAYEMFADSYDGEGYLCEECYEEMIDDDK